jgi:dihydropteroate synthase
MGVLNVTPDSFFDGGQHATTDAAVAYGLDMVAAGADVIDVGGESSRPGAEPVSEREELARVLPVIAALSSRVRVSVDTTKPEVAAAACAAGASLLNDISASLWEVAADNGVGWLAMHMQGTPRTMQQDPRYGDVVAEVSGFLLARATEALSAGVSEVWVDPGIGFGKTLTHNLTLLHHLDQLVAGARAAGCTGVSVGTSRKWFIGMLARRGDGPAAPLDQRAEGSLATAVAAMVAGAGMIRVHDVAATAQAVRLYRPAA